MPRSAHQTLQPPNWLMWLCDWGSIAGHYGKVMGSLVQERRQVWIAQLPLPESYGTTLHHLPLVPCQIFGPAAQEALDRRLVASEAWCQFQEQHASFKVAVYSPYLFCRATCAGKFQCEACHQIDHIRFSNPGHMGLHRDHII